MSLNERDVPIETNCQRLVFVKLLRNHRIILNESMILAIIQAKGKACRDGEEIIMTSGTSITNERL